MSEVERVSIATDDGTPVPALLARPRTAAQPGPGVLVVHDLLGLSADMERIAARFAQEGYVALVPDFFGPGARLPCVVRAVASLRRGGGAPFERLRAAHDHLAGLAEVDPARTGVVGFCIGGGFAVLYAPRSDARAVATFYGDVPRSAEPLRGIPPCVAGYGGRDRIFAPQGRRLAGHLTELGVEHDVKEYPRAGHAYLNQHTGVLVRVAAHSPMAAGFDPEAAADSWDRMLGFFARHLG